MQSSSGKSDSPDKPFLRRVKDLESVVETLTAEVEATRKRTDELMLEIAEMRRLIKDAAPAALNQRLSSIHQLLFRHIQGHGGRSMTNEDDNS
jgi:hypothetical protein